MGFNAIILFALIGTAACAPWRCYRTCDGSTVCFGEVGQPTINPPTICLNRPSPPCTGSATVYTPPCNPCNPCLPCNPCNPCLPCNPCAPCNPCPPCDPCNPCAPCDPCNPCAPCNPCNPCNSCDACNPLLY